MRVLLGSAFTLAWSLYLGGVLVMELIWRPLQRDLAPAQTGVMCLKMGRRYRWFALGTLGLTGATALGLALAKGGPSSAAPPLGLASWTCLLSLVLLMGLLLHPGSHRKARVPADPAAVAASRRRRTRAIRTMNVMLRMELSVALCATVLAAGWANAHGWVV